MGIPFSLLWRLTWLVVVGYITFLCTKWYGRSRGTRWPCTYPRFSGDRLVLKVVAFVLDRNGIKVSAQVPSIWNVQDFSITCSKVAQPSSIAPYAHAFLTAFALVTGATRVPVRQGHQLDRA
jgi:hypothetical protein